MATVTMKQLLEAGIHFGHQTRRWNPKMARYIFGERHGIYIIDLQQTLRQLRKAYIAARDTAANGGVILFVGTKKQARETVQEEAERCGMFYINNRWLGGTLTNWSTIQKSIDKLMALEHMETSGKVEQFTKKEGVQMRKRREKLDKNLAGIKNMGRLPDLIFIVDSHREDIAVAEAKRMGIPCIAICDTNSDPDVVTIPIPGNDDAMRAITLFCSLMADAALEGKMQYEKKRDEQEAEEGTSASTSAKLDKQRSRAGDEAAEAAEAGAPEANGSASEGETPSDTAETVGDESAQADAEREAAAKSAQG